MAIVALFDTTNGFDEVVDIKSCGLRAKTANFNTPRLGLPSTIRKFLWILNGNTRAIFGLSAPLSR
jgi:hypothetical protein